MDPLLSSVYSTIIPSAPYVIAAYAIIWIAVFVYVLVIVRGAKRNERDIATLEQAVEQLREERDASTPDK